jgi:hypothetical protein
MFSSISLYPFPTSEYVHTGIDMFVSGKKVSMLKLKVCNSNSK